MSMYLSFVNGGMSTAIALNVLRLIFRAGYEEPTVCRDKRFIKIQNFLYPRPPAWKFSRGYSLQMLLTLHNEAPVHRCICIKVALQRWLRVRVVLNRNTSQPQQTRVHICICRAKDWSLVYFKELIVAVQKRSIVWGIKNTFVERDLSAGRVAFVGYNVLQANPVALWKYNVSACVM